MATFIRMPEVLANTSEAAVMTWLVEPNQHISVGTPLAEIETEKAVVDYASETEGTVLRLVVAAGQSVAVGEPIAIIGSPGETLDDGATPYPVRTGDSAESADPQLDAAPSKSAQGETMSVPTVTEGSEDAPAGEAPAPPADQGSSTPAVSAGGEKFGAVQSSRSTVATRTVGTFAAANTSQESSSPRLFSSPIVRQLARVQGVDLSIILGTGPNNRIVRRDLQQWVAEKSSAAATAALTAPVGPAESTPGAESPAPVDGLPVETTAAEVIVPLAVASNRQADSVVDVPITAMRRAIARRLTESKTTVPHFYVRADCKVDDLLALRQRVNESVPAKISINDLVLKAAALAYVKVPEANATWGESVIHQHSAVDIAVAVAIDGGLLTPVLRGVDQQTVTAINRQMADLAERARQGTLRQHEIQGGSLSVSNLGMYGVAEFAAIINPPQSAILAVGAARQQAVVEGGAIEIRTVMTVTLSADHRVIDGVLGARWLQAFVTAVENPLALLV